MHRFKTNLHLIAALLVLFPGRAAIAAEPPSVTAAKALPENIQSFQATGPAVDAATESAFKDAEAKNLITVPTAVREYRNVAGDTIRVQLALTEKDSAAYALLTQIANAGQTVDTGVVGIANVDDSHGIVFCKGDALVRIEWAGNTVGSHDELLNISRTFAAMLPAGDDDIPVLVRHLPDGQTSKHCLYTVTAAGLKSFAPGQPILNTISFEGGTEAVTATYPQSQLVIVEFTTPQLAGDNDRNIIATIQELKTRSQPVPTAYRRVGNYSVFVFNGSDEVRANELIDQVKYQQVVQWLGEDPHLYERLQKYFAQTSAGVLIAVLESSGLSLLICLGLGALFGTLLFRYRRAGRDTSYSDAGGTVRLNLDELTGSDDSRRLLKPPSPRESPTNHS